ncbi:MAG: GNAT family N-acetyltransferase [Cyclobacteriaceae bacterium]
MKPVLLTSRLRLIPFSQSDQDLLHQTFTDLFVRKFLWDDEIIPESQTREILEQNEQHFQNDHWGLWKIAQKTDEVYIGFAGLWYFFEEDQPQLLYGLLPTATGQGYATEASRAIVHYAFQELGFSYLIASCDVPHTASRKVAERLGMQFVEERTEQDKPTAFYRLEKA